MQKENPLFFEGHALALISLTKLLRPELSRSHQEILTILIISEGSSSIALVVDTIMNIEDVVIGLYLLF